MDPEQDAEISCERLDAEVDIHRTGMRDAAPQHRDTDRLAGGGLQGIDDGPKFRLRVHSPHHNRRINVVHRVGHGPS